jgi:hypothetical protein
MTPSKMRAVVFDHALRFVPDYPVRNLRPGWALIRVLNAGSFSGKSQFIAACG